MDHFEAEPASHGWKFVNGEEFPGAKGSMSWDQGVAHEGKGSCRLEGDFSGGGAYVGLWKMLAASEMGKFEELRFWVKAEGTTALAVRLMDETGQFHQKAGVPLAAGGAWQEVVLKLSDVVGGEHWGGANDGKWHGSVEGIGVNLEVNQIEGGKKGTLWVDDMRLVPAAEGRPTLLACSLSQAECRPVYGVTVHYRWDAEPMSRDYSVFVHLIGPDGKMVFQDDHDPPQATSVWQGRVEYDHTLVVPVNAPPGEYQIIAGLWHGKTSTRGGLRAGEGATEVEPGSCLVGRLKITPDAPLPVLGEPTLKLDGYHVTFDEDFTDKELSVSAGGPGTRWIAHTPFSLDFGDAPFTDPEKGFPFTVENGMLKIEARQTNGHWRSGLLASVDKSGKGFSQKYGYFEMRAKLPKGEGVWPAFWLMSATGLTDKSRTTAEIDILEQYGVNPNALYMTLHHWYPGGKHSSEPAVAMVPGMTDGFHRYGVLLDEKEMIFYFDGIEMKRMKTTEDAKEPMYPLVNLALGGGWPIAKTPNPSVLIVDYVRVWAK